MDFADRVLLAIRRRAAYNEERCRSQPSSEIQMEADQARANVSEVFSSIQGEGVYVGRRQVFVRFYGCNLKCRYCDTPRTRAADGRCGIETEPGTGRFVAFEIPIDAEKLTESVTFLAKQARHHSIILTGGEPLLHADFLRHWLPALLGGPGIHLETNGTLPDALEKIIDLVNVTAMDIKLPSATGMTPQWDQHISFLRVAASREVFVKVVFSEDTPDAELDEVARIVSSVSPPPAVVLQPVTGAGAPPPGRILSSHAFLSNRLPNVLVIPQTHKIIGCA